MQAAIEPVALRTCSASSTTTATGVPTGMSLEPAGRMILARNPSSWASQSIVACAHKSPDQGRSMERQADTVPGMTS